MKSVVRSYICKEVRLAGWGREKLKLSPQLIPFGVLDLG